MNSLHYDLVMSEITIQNRLFRLWRIRNLDDLVDQVSDALFDEDERLPYWAELWPSAYALTEFILTWPEKIARKSVLELGCGLGLTSMGIAVCRPAHFIATDYENDALEHCRRNFNANDLPLPELMEMDWRRPHLTDTFDVIAASDVVYEQRFFEPLIRLFGRYLKPEGRILLAEPNRSVARGFFGKLVMAGFSFERYDMPVVQDAQKITVTIYEIYKTKTG